MTTLESLDQRVTRLEERSNLQTALERHTSILFADLTQLITDLATSQRNEFVNIHRRVSSLEERVASIDERMASMEERV
ncbi:MAG: hypothetical protein OXG78_15480, partial [Chloroflexi bacterium]|nr:hypothetical protein [Chloroflexota bacterium]